MCEGKGYDEKSDIWALGCILYEMACLQKTFEGLNLPALVNKIMRGAICTNQRSLFTQVQTISERLITKGPRISTYCYDSFARKDARINVAIF